MGLLADKIRKKNSSNLKKLDLHDVNHDLIIALMSEDVFGKDVRDDDIMRIIINSGKAYVTKLDNMSETMAALVKNAKCEFVEESVEWIYNKDHYETEDGFTCLSMK